MPKVFHRPALIAVLVLAAAPGAAHASPSGDIHRECQAGTIARDYSSAELAAALRSIPTDLDEYTDCRDVIRRAQLDGTGTSPRSDAKRGPGAVNSGAVPPPSRSPRADGAAEGLLKAATPAERVAVEAAVREPAAPVEVGGEQLSPVVAGYSPAGAANVVPTPLVVAFLMLGVGLAFGGISSIRRRILAHRA